MPSHNLWLTRGLAAALALAGAFAGLAQSDITQPGDPIVASSANSPGSEGPANAIDNQPTKYLNFDGKNDTPSGFTVTPSVGQTIVTGITLQSANDGPERDPATYELTGSNDGGTTFEIISAGAVPAFSARFETVTVNFQNSKAYTSYKLMFPTTAGASTCCMQVAEVELLGTVVPPDVTQPGDLVSGSSSNSPGSEGPANAIDNQPTKYLNFDGKNNTPSGLTITPAVGATIVTGISLESANDSPDRDPATYELAGSNDDGATFTVISSGPVPAFTARFQWVQVFFANANPYKSYRLMFPTTAGASTCCMQVAEVELLGTVAPQDVTQPGDPVVGSSSNSPGSEGPANAIDNQPTKYLNFDGKNNTPSGFSVTPSVGKTIVTGLTLTSANDSPDRDPATYELSGSNDGTTYTLISAGEVPSFGTERFKTVEVFFENSTPYTGYKLMFPTTAGASTCCMQISEVQFLGFSADSAALPQFKTQPVPTPVLVGATARFFVTVNGPWQIQWYKNNTAIVGANQLSYTTDVITEASGNDVYYATAKNGSLISQSDSVRPVIFVPSTVKSVSVNFDGSGANGAPTSLVPTDIAGVQLSAYWNNAPGNSGDLPTTDAEGNPIPVTDSDNVESTITVNYQSNASWGTGTGTDSGQRKMLNGYLDPNNNNNAATVTFANVPAGSHSILVYTINRPLAFNDANYFVQGAATSPTIYIRAQNADEYNATPGFIRGNSTDPNNRTVANYVRFDKIQPDASGTITLTAQSILESGESPAGTAPINGIQLLINPPDVGNPPEITQQPTSKVVVPGSTATFSSAATGTGTLSYQWRKGTQNLTDGGRVSGAQTATLSISSVEAGDAGVYSVVIGNAAGTANSVPAVLSTYNGLIGDRMVAHWTFDETAGLLAANSIPGGDSGALNGYVGDNSQWVAGRIGGALSFDGASHFVIVPNYTKASTAVSISGWAWSAANGSSANIIANAGTAADSGIRLSQFELGLFGDTGDLRGLVVAGPNAYVSREGEANPFTTGSWHHVAMVADGTQLSLYRDGQLVDQVDYLGQITSATAQCLGIGGFNAPTCDAVLEATPGLWTGNLDDIALWTRPLGVQEVQAIYAAGLAGNSVSTIPPVNPPVTPEVSVGTNASGDVVITFTGTLQSSPTLNGTYGPVAGATAPTYTVPKASQGDGQYYRSSN